MINIRPVGYVVGWLIAALGLSMSLPLAADMMSGRELGGGFASIAIVTLVIGGMVTFACASGRRETMNVQESFLLATSIWVVFPFFGALPFWFGAPGASFTDAFFEAMSALTTTGSTVFIGLETFPPGTLLWRGMLQWFGGLGILVVAIVFLPALKVGGMQFFRSEAFDTLGKILPRAGEIAASLAWIYVTLTFLCFMGYVLTGMNAFDAFVHSMTTIATGGMANYDSSFAAFSAGAHYVAALFMALAALPFVRYVQFVAGSPLPFFRDLQIQGFMLVMLVTIGLLSAWLAFGQHAELGMSLEQTFREVLFNVVSIGTGTGYASTDYGLWGSFAVALFFVVGLIGGCTGSTACSVKIFRYQILLSAVSAEIQRLYSPNRVFVPRYDGRRISDDVLNSVIAFFMMFYLTLGIVAVLLVMIGLEPITAISGAATALANIGPGLGPEIGPAGNFAGLPDAAKWILAGTMLIGRLELMTVFVLFTAAYWRA